MKKITLALCACAFALTGLLASCSNESTSANYIDRSTNSSNYKYAVNGTIVSTSSNSYEDSSKKVSAYTSTSTSKIDGGFVTVSWAGDENRESNYTSYTVNGTVKSTKTSKQSSTYDDKALSGWTSGTEAGTESIDFIIQDVDGEKYFLLKTNEVVGSKEVWVSGYTVLSGWYETSIISSISNPEELSIYYPVSVDENDVKYATPSDPMNPDPEYVGGAVWVDGWTVSGHNEYEPVYGDIQTKTFKMDDIAASEDDDAFSGDFGGEFSINIKIASKDEGLEYSKENKAQATNSKTLEYKLTFVPVESYDPEDFVEED